jgi:hypothetical protein
VNSAARIVVVRESFDTSGVFLSLQRIIPVPEYVTGTNVVIIRFSKGNIYADTQSIGLMNDELFLLSVMNVNP